MLSKVLRLFTKDKQIKSTEVVESTALTTKELPQILDKTGIGLIVLDSNDCICLLYTSPSPRDRG